MSKKTFSGNQSLKTLNREIGANHHHLVTPIRTKTTEAAATQLFIFKHIQTDDNLVKNQIFMNYLSTRVRKLITYCK